MSDKSIKNKIFKYLKWLVPVIGVVILVVILNRKNAKTVVVREIRPEERLVVRTVSASGEVVSKKEANLSFSLVGTIDKIYIQENENTQKGALLVKLENTQQYQSYQSAKDSRDIALRDKDIYIHTENDGEDTEEAKIRRFNEYISKAEAGLASAQAALSKTFMYAPFEGFVLNVTKEEGETTSIGETVITLVNPNELQFEIEVDQEDFGYLKEGQEVQITLDAYNDIELEGTINKLPKYANGGTASAFEVKVDFSSEAEKEIFIGMLGDVEIIVSTTNEEVPSLIFDQITTDIEGKTFVWVERNGTIYKKYIETGLEGDVYTQIISDIEDTIVIPVDNGAEIEEGFQAKIVNN